MFGVEIQILIEKVCIFSTVFHRLSNQHQTNIYVVYQTLNIILILKKKIFSFGVSLELLLLKNRLLECQLLVTPELRPGYRGICGVVKLFLLLL